MIKKGEERVNPHFLESNRTFQSSFKGFFILTVWHPGPRWEGKAAENVWKILCCSNEMQSLA
jgi:hypothetical protein